MAEQQDRLAEIKARMASFSGPLEQNQLEVIRAIDRDLPWLVHEVEYLRALVAHRERTQQSGSQPEG